MRERRLFRFIIYNSNFMFPHPAVKKRRDYRALSKWHNLDRGAEAGDGSA